ncbi:glycosyltransferase family 4 protein [Flavihumibacter rivuli]|uniref:glycosyltransferase family 4 protein n=1 Tax=Flavihumibacter rivuli TaxID=2838156 RepID=UPI001BDF4C48|nr:glycosyltransferase family 4 protein [Flavihumibacter rivuli]ULQ56256.1 glycosyltransferase family 4 protein [Flavihumibacter rivuli]
MNGGGLRCYHLLKEMSEQFEVDAVVLQRLSGPVQPLCPYASFIYPTSGEFERFKKAGLLKRICRSLVYKWNTGFYRLGADFNYLLMRHLLGSKPLAHDYDVIVFEHYQSMLLAPLLRKKYPNSLFVLDAHNVDHRLLLEEQEKKPTANFDILYKYVHRLESELGKYVDQVWVCSQYDAEILAELNKGAVRMVVVPNGVDTDEKLPVHCSKPITEPILLFCGDLNTVANSGGLVWFLDQVYPQLKERFKGINLLIAGSGNDNPIFNQYKEDPSVTFMGRVDDLREFYSLGHISIAPLLVGSGTRLKILEALSFGIPMVATGKGAEGVDYINGKHLKIADAPNEFGQAIAELINDGELRRTLATNGREFVVNNFDWGVIGRTAINSLTRI